MTQYEPLSDRTAARGVVAIMLFFVILFILLVVIGVNSALSQTLGTVTAGSTPWDNTPHNVSITVPSGATGLLVTISGQGGHDSIAYNGTKMTYVDGSSGSSNVKAYKLANPTSGTHNVTIYRDSYTFEQYCIVPIEGGGSDVTGNIQKLAYTYIAGGTLTFSNTDGQIILVHAVEENTGNGVYWSPYGTWYLQDSSNYPPAHASILTADSANQQVAWWTGDTPTANTVGILGVVLDAPNALEDTVLPSISGPVWRPRSTQSAAAINYLTFQVTDGPAEFAGIESVYVWLNSTLKYRIYTANSPADTTLDSLNMGGWVGDSTVTVRAVDDSNNVTTRSFSRRSGIPTVTSVTGYLPVWSWGTAQGRIETGGQDMVPSNVPWNVLTHVVHFGINALDTAGWKRDSIYYGGDNKQSEFYPYATLTNRRHGWFAGRGQSRSGTANAVPTSGQWVPFSSPLPSGEAYWDGVQVTALSASSGNVTYDSLRYDGLKVYPTVEGANVSYTVNWARWVEDSLSAYNYDVLDTAVTWDSYDYGSFQIATDSADLLHNYWREVFRYGDGVDEKRYLDSMWKYSRPPVMTGGLIDSVQILLSIGGISGGGQQAYNFLHQKSDSVWMYDLYAAITGFANRRQYDGLEIDWEPPLSRDDQSKQIRMMKREMTRQGGTANTLAIAAAGSNLDRYDPAYADSMFRYNIMMYDGTFLSSGWAMSWYTPATRMGMNAATYNLPLNDTSKYGHGFYYINFSYEGLGYPVGWGTGWHYVNDAYENENYSPSQPRRVAGSVPYFVDSIGMPAEKVGTLMPTFGYIFSRVGESDSVLQGVDGGQIVRKRGLTRTIDTYPFPGQRPYYEIWDTTASHWDTVQVYQQYIFDNLVRYMIDNNGLGATIVYDDTMKVPFMSGRSTFNPATLAYWPMPDSGDAFYMTYDDTTSMKEKVRWAKSMGIGGVGFYEVFAAWNANNSNDRLPLIRVAMQELQATEEPPAEDSVLIWYVQGWGLGNWGQSPTQFHIDSLDLNKVSHIVWFFGSNMDSTGGVVNWKPLMDNSALGWPFTQGDSVDYHYNGNTNPRGGPSSWVDNDLTRLRTRATTAGVKLLASVTDIDACILKWVAVDSTRTQTMADKVVGWIKRHDFDGVDFNFENTGCGAGSVDTTNWNRWFRIWRRALDSAEVAEGRQLQMTLVPISWSWETYGRIGLNQCDYIIPQFQAFHSSASCQDSASNLVWHINPLEIGWTPDCDAGSGGVQPPAAHSQKTKGPIQWNEWGVPKSKIVPLMPAYAAKWGNVDSIWWKWPTDANTVGNPYMYEVGHYLDGADWIYRDTYRKAVLVGGTYNNSDPAYDTLGNNWYGGAFTVPNQRFVLSYTDSAFMVEIVRYWMNWGVGGVSLYGAIEDNVGQHLGLPASDAWYLKDAVEVALSPDGEPPPQAESRRRIRIFIRR